jgi:hypothetical protein
MFVPGVTRRPGWGPGQAAQRRKRQDNRLAKPQIVTALGIYLKIRGKFLKFVVPA